MSSPSEEAKRVEREGGYAFACAAENGHQGGMTLRDYFAGQALPGLIVNGSTVNPHVPLSVRAWEIADAMLASRGGR